MCIVTKKINFTLIHLLSKMSDPFLSQVIGLDISDPVSPPDLLH